MLGIVDKITASPRPNQPEKVRISVAEGPTGCRDLCIENILTDENGDDMKLKKGDRVEVTIEVKNVKAGGPA